jgi:hypothetical protein
MLGLLLAFAKAASACYYYGDRFKKANYLVLRYDGTFRTK